MCTRKESRGSCFNSIHTYGNTDGLDAEAAGNCVEAACSSFLTALLRWNRINIVLSGSFSTCNTPVLCCTVMETTSLCKGDRPLSLFFGCAQLVRRLTSLSFRWLRCRVLRFRREPRALDSGVDPETASLSKGQRHYFLTFAFFRDVSSRIPLPSLKNSLQVD